MYASLEEASVHILAALHRRRNLEGFDDLALSVTCRQGAGRVAIVVAGVGIGSGGDQHLGNFRVAFLHGVNQSRVADATVSVDVGAASNDSANLVRLAIGGGSHQGGIAIVVALYGLCDLDVGYFLNGGFVVAGVG